MRDLKNQLHQIVLPIGTINKNNHIDLLGTSFLLSNNLICTAYHNIAHNSDLAILLPRIKNINEFQNYSDKSCNYKHIEIYKINPHRDIALLKLKDESYFEMPMIFDFVNAQILSESIIVGYPHSTEDPKGRVILTFQKTYVGSKILLDSEIGSVKNKNYILNTQTRPGQSGSPMFDKNFNLCGMIVGAYKISSEGGGIMIGHIDPTTLNQTTYAISSEHIMEML